MISLVTITHDPSTVTLRNVDQILEVARETHPDVETLVIDTSMHNIGYGGALNQAAAHCRGDLVVYFSSNRARMLDKRWLSRIIAPLSDPNCGMSGCVRPCSFACIARQPCDIWQPQIHIQGGVFAARSAVLRENPWSPNFPQVHSDVYQSWNLMKSGYWLADVPEVQSEAGGRAKPAMMVCDYGQDADLDGEFDRLCRTESDINEHGVTLRDLSARANRVTEFGVRTGRSTTFFLAGRPQTLQSFDIDPAVDIQPILKFVPVATDFQFVLADSRQVGIDITDLLFIDTEHTYEHLTTELTRHCNRVTRRIALHDTVFAPELLQAANDFVAENSEWQILQHYDNNNGLTILERQSGYPR